jgi:transcriptional regulator of acetoin/glycerol metabolism
LRFPVRTTARDDILQALQKTGGNKTEAARLLGINRRTVYRKIHKSPSVNSI